jgi:hypothetical protein
MIHSTSRSEVPSHQQDFSAAYLTRDGIRRMVGRCQELASRYHTNPAVVLERAWWHAFHEAGTHLRDALEACRDRWDQLCLPAKEIELAYWMLIHVAYFFEPGGVAEVIFQQQGWAWLDEQSEQTA